MKHVLDVPSDSKRTRFVTAQLNLPWKKYPTESAQVAGIDRLLRAIQANPGFAAVAASDLLPFWGDEWKTVTALEGDAQAPSDLNMDYRNGVVGNYWRALSIPLIEGRFLDSADSERKQRVCVIDQTFAQRHWPGKSALGHRLNDGASFNEGEAFTIVGVVGSVEQKKLDDTKPLGSIYYPFKYWARASVSLIIRTRLPMDAVARAVRRTVLQIDPELPVERFQLMKNLVDDSLEQRRAVAVLSGVFALFALLLTAVGTYGVLAYVSQRRCEIGIRIALGAQPRQVLAHFLGVAARLLLVGVAIGIFGAWVAGKSMYSLLFGVDPMNFVAFAITSGIIIIVVLFATLLPSRRASLIRPTEALRSE